MTETYRQKYPYARYKAREEIRRWRRKNVLIERLGGKCVRCGWGEHPAALDFHHKDPATKEFNIAPSLGRAMEILEREVDKCELLCANCHRIEHSSYCPDRVELDPGRKPNESRKNDNAHKVLHAYGSLEEYEKAGGRGQSYTKKKRGLYWVAYCPSLSHAHLLAGVSFSEIYFHGIEREIEAYLLAHNKKAGSSDPALS